MGLPLTSDLASARLAVAALGETSYRDLLDLQARWLAAGVPSLFVTADPDGLRVGPLTVPGASPCFACAQLAALGVLRLAPEETLAVAAGFRTGRLDLPGLDRAAGLLAAEVRAFLDPRATPELLGGILQIPPFPLGEGGEGLGVRRLPVDRRPDCPLCGSVRGGESAHDALRAERIRIESAERQLTASRAGGPVESEGLVASVGLLGGGTAGYLAALALRRKVPGLAVTLIESPDVPIIGVGEATTPLMPQFLHVDLGLDIHRLFREVRPTLKLGIRFLWGAPGTGDFHYPFGPVRFLEPVVHGGGIKEVSLQSLLMAAGAVPLYRENGALVSRIGTEAAYHLDNERFVAYLQRRAEEAGIERIAATVAEVERTDSPGDTGEVRALRTTDGRRLSFDLYVDCTGFRSLLLEQALGSPWIELRRRACGPTARWWGRCRTAARSRPYTTAETMSCRLVLEHPAGGLRPPRLRLLLGVPDPGGGRGRDAPRLNPGLGRGRGWSASGPAGTPHFWKGNVVALGNCLRLRRAAGIDGAPHADPRRSACWCAPFRCGRESGGLPALR